MNAKLKDGLLLAAILATVGALWKLSIDVNVIADSFNRFVTTSEKRADDFEARLRALEAK